MSGAMTVFILLFAGVSSFTEAGLQQSASALPLIASASVSPGDSVADAKQESPAIPALPVDADSLKKLVTPEDSPISEKEIVAAQQFGQTLSVAEWLGPLAPVALSPFFGIACLSGMSLFGGGWISPGNPLLGSESPLHHPEVFWIFLGLTLLTSIPRMTKVSKPFAQAVDQLESWSGIVTMLLLKMILSTQGDSQPEAAEVVQAGLFSFSADTLLMLIGAINVFVISAVRFFFEILVWLTPFPTLDAVFEVTNKAVCAGLMAVYGWSPTLAMTINLVLFAICLLIFGWIQRRVTFFRTLLLDAFLSLFIKSHTPETIIVFPCSPVGGIATRARCQLSFHGDEWRLIWRRFMRLPLSVSIVRMESQPVLETGLLSNTIRFTEPAVVLTFSRRHQSQIDELAVKHQLRRNDASEQSSGATLRMEFN